MNKERLEPFALQWTGVSDSEREEESDREKERERERNRADLQRAFLVSAVRQRSERGREREGKVNDRTLELLLELKQMCTLTIELFRR